MGLDNSDTCTEADRPKIDRHRRLSDQTKSINSEHVSSTKSTGEVHQPNQPSQLISQPTQLSQPLPQPTQPSQTLTPAQSQEENKRMLYSKYRFKQGSKLLQYIMEYTTRHQELYTLAEVSHSLIHYQLPFFKSILFLMTNYSKVY